MTDREKVIKAIDICLGHGHCDDCGYRIKGGYSTMDCRRPMMRDALALLKEQDDLGKELENAMELIHKKNERLQAQPKIIRCKDCKHGKQLFVDYISCQISEENESGCHVTHNPDWFCADGE